ncbi:MAG TPA: DUF222 domain-containing protein [Micromonosporaceae bacterium]|nr:DUF222 domain-containing protein [Micromonosporaceae bacterium]
MRVASAMIARAVDEYAATAVWALPDDELVDALGELHVLQQRLAAVNLALVREVDGRGLAVAQGASSTAVWLRGRMRMSIGVARRLVELAAAVDAGPAVVRDGLAAGALSLEQAQVVTQAVAALPAEVGPRGGGQGRSHVGRLRPGLRAGGAAPAGRADPAGGRPRDGRAGRAGRAGAGRATG